MLQPFCPQAFPAAKGSKRQRLSQSNLVRSPRARCVVSANSSSRNSVLPMPLLEKKNESEMLQVELEN